MSPEAAAHLGKTRECLGRARFILAAGVFPVAAIACLASPCMAQQGAPPQPAQVASVVEHCVEFVHQFPTHNQMDMTTNEGFFKKFDAFYNAASGTVQNNATEAVGDTEPLYEFNKCMASEGLPLK